MTPGSLIQLCIGLPLAIAVLNGPGILTAFSCRLPFPWLSGLAVSWLAWFNLVISIQLIGLPLTRVSLLLPWLGWLLIMILVNRASLFRNPLMVSLRTVAKQVSRQHLNTLPQKAWLTAGLFGFGSILLRAFIDPLSGWDNDLRWNAIAVEAFQRQHLDFFPVFQPADFEILAWWDGMPPLISLLNFWFYLILGEPSRIYSTGRVIVEAVGIYSAVNLLAARQAGTAAGLVATGLLATSSLALWHVAMGQETGGLALSLLGMLLCLRKKHTDYRTTIAGGLFAAVGLLCREYGGAYGVLGLIIVCLRDRSAVRALVFSAAWLGPGLLWFARCWAITGNPIYPLGPIGLPWRPPAYGIVTDAIAHCQSYDHLLSYADVLFNIFLVVGGVVTAFGLMGCVHDFLCKKYRQWPLWLSITLGISLWFASVPKTGGGFEYSLKVLGPVLAVLAVTAGQFIVNLPARAFAVLSLCSVPLAADAALRSWTLPVRAEVGTTAALSAWREMRQLEEAPEPIWNDLSRRFPDGFFLVDSPNPHIRLKRAGARASMTLSPIAAACFKVDAAADAILADLRAVGVTHVVLSVHPCFMNWMYRDLPFFTWMLQTIKPCAMNEAFYVYDIERLHGHATAPQPGSPP